MIDDPSHHEQEVREAVHVDDDDRVNGAVAQTDNATFGTAAHRPCEMKRRTGRASAGEDELA